VLEFGGKNYLIDTLKKDSTTEVESFFNFRISRSYEMKIIWDDLKTEI
jgi:hypothetical protein